MRYLLTLFLIGILCTCGRAQVGGSVDAEYASWCMVDSIAPNNVVRFSRLVNIATLDVVDISPTLGTAYTVSGTLLTCEEYDIGLSTRAVGASVDTGGNCQCEYTIEQQNHLVDEVRGGTIQDYIVAFDEVVSRQCSDEDSPTVISRTTLRDTFEISVNSRVGYSTDFTQVGDIVEEINFRLYPTTGPAVAVTVDLDPATVQASYPTLTLDPADFAFDGGNAAAIAAAYTVVIQHAVGATENLIQARFSSGNNVEITSQWMHEPAGPYAILPAEGDADLLYTGSGVPNPFAIVVYGGSAVTTTTNYTEYCDPIVTAELETYVRYNAANPTQVAIELSPDPLFLPGSSTPSTFCTLTPAECTKIIPNPITVAGCVEICSDVQNIAGQASLANIDTMLTAATYNSLSVYVATGPVGITLNGVRIDYPTGYVTSWTAQEGKLLQNAISIDATGGAATITHIR